MGSMKSTAGTFHPIPSTRKSQVCPTARDALGGEDGGVGGAVGGWEAVRSSCCRLQMPWQEDAAERGGGGMGVAGSARGKSIPPAPLFRGIPAGCLSGVFGFGLYADPVHSIPHGNGMGMGVVRVTSCGVIDTALVSLSWVKEAGQTGTTASHNPQNGHDKTDQRDTLQ